MKVRKPRNIFVGDFQAFIQADGLAVIQTYFFAHTTLSALRRLHNWLGRYIAWHEQREGK